MDSKKNIDTTGANWLLPGLINQIDPNKETTKLKIVIFNNLFSKNFVNKNAIRKDNK